MAQVRLKEELKRVKEVGNRPYTSVAMTKPLRFSLAQSILQVSSVSTEQSQTCAKNHCCFQKFRPGKLVAEEESETMVPPSDVLIEINSRRTNDPACEDTLRKYKQQIEHLLEDLRIDKICSGAGSTLTFAPGQYFVTIGYTELAKLDAPIACREYTLPRKKESTMAKGWIHENTKIGPLLKVTVS